MHVFLGLRPGYRGRPRPELLRVTSLDQWLQVKQGGSVPLTQNTSYRLHGPALSCPPDGPTPCYSLQTSQGTPIKKEARVVVLKWFPSSSGLAHAQGTLRDK